MKVKRRVAVVTGASGGVGRATARAFAERDYDVAVLARGAAGLDGVADEVRQRGVRAVVLPCDVADADAVERAAEQTQAELGSIDVWVNAAFTSVFAPFTQIRPEEFERVTRVTYLGYVHGTQAALRRMLPLDRGVVVQVGSALAYRAVPLQSAYCGAKHAIQGFNEALRCELLHERTQVRTTMVQLPAMNTPQFDWVLNRLQRKPQPVPPIYQPEVAARTIVHAAEHPRRREWWVGETTALTLLANALAPGLLDRYLAKTGFASQQTTEPATQGAPCNLWQPADRRRDFGAHGRFDDRALPVSPQAWASRHHTGVGLAAAAGGLAVLSRARR